MVTLFYNKLSLRSLFWTWISVCYVFYQLVKGLPEGKGVRRTYTIAALLALQEEQQFQGRVQACNCRTCDKRVLNCPVFAASTVLNPLNMQLCLECGFLRRVNH